MDSRCSKPTETFKLLVTCMVCASPFSCMAYIFTYIVTNWIDCFSYSLIYPNLLLFLLSSNVCNISRSLCLVDISAAKGLSSTGITMVSYWTWIKTILFVIDQLSMVDASWTLYNICCDFPSDEFGYSSAESVNDAMLVRQCMNYNIFIVDMNPSRNC